MLHRIPSFCRISHARMPSQVLAILIKIRDLSTPVTSGQENNSGRVFMSMYYDAILMKHLLWKSLVYTMKGSEMYDKER